MIEKVIDVDRVHGRKIVIKYVLGQIVISVISVYAPQTSDISIRQLKQPV